VRDKEGREREREKMDIRLGWAAAHRVRDKRAGPDNTGKYISFIGIDMLFDSVRPPEAAN
jgi:hypothetical protein